jgi:hypothetical protein
LSALISRTLTKKPWVPTKMSWIRRGAKKGDRESLFFQKLRDFS